MTDNGSTNSKKWIVAIQQDCPTPGQTIGTLFKMNDPGTGDIRDYAIMSSIDGNVSYIAEFQIMPGNFSSFIVGRHVVKDGNLYLINRIDPLYFYLATQSIDEQKQEDINNRVEKVQAKKQSWQPYDQFLEQSKLPEPISKAISEEQIQHICLTFDNDERYFRFNVDKALHWLQKKQERVLESLIGQDQRRRNANQNSSIATNESYEVARSISENFNFGKPAAAVAPAAPAAPAPLKKSQSDTDSLKIESFQIICNYLDENWSKKLVQHLGYTMEQVTSGTKTIRNSSIISNNDDSRENCIFKEDDTNRSIIKKTAASDKATTAARTVGNKRLANLSTKGMRSIGSFFSAGKAKKTKR